MTTLAERLADHVTTDPADDPDVQRWAAGQVLDTAAAALAGVTATSSEVLARALARWSPPSAPVTVVGRGRSLDLLDAVLVNGATAHAAELDDDHRRATVHPGAVVVPAALGMAEATGATGATFLRAVTHGYEVTCRIGEAFGGTQFYAGFHPTGTCGVFGAAAAAGVVLGLDRDAMVAALGVAGTQASGLGEWRSDGSWTKRLHPGRSAHAGVLAALAAQEGFTGPATILEGPQGFLRAFAHGGCDPGAVTRGLGTERRAAGTAFKPYPGCRFAHGAVDLALAAVADGLRPGDVESVVVDLFETDVLTDDRRPASEVQAQFSVPYLVAAALVRGRLGLAEMTAGAVADPAVLAVAARVAVRLLPEHTAAYPDRYPTTLTITTTGGRRTSSTTDCPLGDPESPAYRDRPDLFRAGLERKVAEVLHDVGLGDRHAALVAAVDGLARAPGVGELAAVLGEAAPAAPPNGGA